ncbi:MAG: F0F1 ATP synthase subunit A [Anaerolineae bacterium]|nr:F0F1 ATP synthase subunit A [Anaerolineae bacterium]
MTITPDTIIWGQVGPFTINATIGFTWVVMVLMTVGSWLVTRNLSTGREISWWQSLLEQVVEIIESQIREVAEEDPSPYVAFIGTVFLFILVSNVLMIVPGFQSPTASLSTTAALAICVFVAVPAFGIARRGLVEYLKSYLKPSVIMLPFNIIGEFSRTLALAVRLYGNVMSGGMIVAILVTIVPLLFPVVMQALGLITGVIQAYIFAILATIYIASATRARRETEQTGRPNP